MGNKERGYQLLLETLIIGKGSDVCCERGVMMVLPVIVTLSRGLNDFGRRKSVRLGISRQYVRLRRITLKNDSLKTVKRIPIRGQ